MYLFVAYSSRQRDLYDETFKPIVDSVLEGYNGNVSIRMLLILFYC